MTLADKRLSFAALLTVTYGTFATILNLVYFGSLDLNPLIDVICREHPGERVYVPR